MKNSIFTIFFSALLTFCTYSSYAQVSGIVYRDINGNGVKNNTTFFNEGFVQGVTVKAFDNSGTQVGGTQTTNASGSYSFTGITLPVRIEFSNVPSNNFSAPNGTTSKTSVQFVTTASNSVNFGVYTSEDYCQPNPDLYVTCFIHGDPLPNGSAAGGEVAIVKIPYNTPNQSNTPPIKMVNGDKVGSVWGAAYHQQSKTLITAALLKRHVGLGPGGLGGIYKTDVVTNATSLMIDLESAPFSINLGQSIIAGRTLPTSTTTASEDALAFDAVGKVGLGAVSISDDQKDIYVVDLFNRQVIKIAVGSPLKTSFTAADVTTLPAIPDAGCNNGVTRPFAVTYHKGKVYVGVVCTGETSGTKNNLKASVFEYDPGTNAFVATPVATFPLNYNKGKVHTGETSAPDEWNPWISTWSGMYTGATAGGATRTMKPQPILSDIDFLDNGDMILGFMDRAGHQLGFQNRGVGTGNNLYSGYIGGDILRLSKSGSTYTLESNGSVGGITSTGGANNGQGPGTPGGEFYNNEQFSGNNGLGFVEIHQETYMGSTIFVPGNEQLIATVMDPISVFSGGFSWFSNTNGINDKRYEIYATLSDGGQTFGKANGLGAIAVGCNLPTIEVGNRLWNDLNQNGVQDPNEPGINGVQIQLFEGTTATGTPSSTLTANGGQWYFGNLKENTDYTVKVNTPLNTGTLVGLEQFSEKNAAAGGILADSDVNPDGTITFRTGAFGDNNHNFDIGVTACIKPDAGPDVVMCLPKTTLNFTDAISGQEWQVGSVAPPNATPSIDPVTGEVTGLTEIGEYEFVLKVTGFSCEDIVKVTVNAETPHLLCNDGSTSVTATAEAGLTNIIWYNQANQQVGTGLELTITSNMAGLSDGREWFYYVGKDANNCDKTLCCPVSIITEDCCPTPNCLNVTVIKN